MSIQRKRWKTCTIVPKKFCLLYLVKHHFYLRFGTIQNDLLAWNQWRNGWVPFTVFGKHEFNKSQLRITICVGNDVAQPDPKWLALMTLWEVKLMIHISHISHENLDFSDNLPGFWFCLSLWYFWSWWLSYYSIMYLHTASVTKCKWDYQLIIYYPF